MQRQLSGIIIWLISLLLMQAAHAALPDLAISKTASSPIAQMGTTVAYTVMVKNIGTVAAPNVLITDQIPANNVFVPALSSPQWTLQDGVLKATIASIAAGQTVSLKVTCSFANPLLSTVSMVQTAQEDTSPSDNTCVFNKNIAVEYPYLKTVTQMDPATTKLSRVRYLLGFSKPVTGINKADFKIHTTGTVNATPAVSAANAELTSYTLQLQYVSGNGLLWADLNDDNSIVDSNAKPFGGPEKELLPLGKVYTIDQTPPVSQAHGAAATVPPGKTFYVTFGASDNSPEIGVVDLYFRKGAAGPFTLFGASPNGYFMVDPWLLSPGGDGEYQFYTIARDKAGNAEVAPSSADLILDFHSKTGTVSWVRYK